MQKKDILGIIYVSTLIVVWGTIGSLIDFPLLKNDVYTAGSIGQITTFAITGLITTVVGIILFPKITNAIFND